MPATSLAPHQLRLTIDPATLGFASTAELQGRPLPWIGQERAQAAAQFGLRLQHPDYHLFVLGEAGSGRASLLHQAMLAAASERPAPPDLCYLHNFDAPERPHALRLPAGQGRVLRQALQDALRQLQSDIPQRLASPACAAEAERIDRHWQAQEAEAMAQLAAFARERHFRLSRDGGQWVFTLTGATGQPLTDTEARELTPERRAQISADEQALRAEIERVADQTRPLARAREEAQAHLRRSAVAPLVEQALQAVRARLLVPSQPQAPQGPAEAAAPTGTPGSAAPQASSTEAAPGTTAIVTSPIAPTPADSTALPATLLHWLEQVQRTLLDHIDLFDGELPASAAYPAADALSPYPATNHSPHASAPRSSTARGADDDGSDGDDDEDDDRRDALDDLLDRCRVNVVVDHHGQSAAPVVVEDNPTVRTLFGGIEHQSDANPATTGHLSVRAGSLLAAHGGFILLHLNDLTAEEGLWPRLRRFLRSHRVQIEDGSGGAPQGGGGSLAVQPEAVDAQVKIVLIGSVEEYYALQEADPDTARRFRVKVDFVERFAATPATREATAIFVAHSCQRHGLPHFAADAVARLLEQAHRDADDQGRQSALFAHTEALLIESAALCSARGDSLVRAADVDAALQARRLRHNYPEEQLHESIAEGERLITLTGSAVGQINAMTQIDLGDYRFGFPVRITARTFAGQEGLLNIEREVDMSGPIHDKGVLILHSYLTALFSHVAPLALNASIVFEQEYSGVEGDSASCAELYALLSSLSGLPLRQGLAVTGALNQHGEVLPVGGINEKIEGWFLACQAAGLDGTQGVLIPARNQRHLMLSRSVQDAVERGLFHVYTMGHVSECIALLTGEASGMSPAELALPGGAAALAPEDHAAQVELTVLQRAEQTLKTYRRACQSAGQTRRARPGRLR